MQHKAEAVSTPRCTPKDLPSADSLMAVAFGGMTATTWVQPPVPMTPWTCSVCTGSVASSVAWGSVRFIVPVHSPETILCRKRCFCSSLPRRNTASIAPWGSVGVFDQVLVQAKAVGVIVVWSAVVAAVSLKNLLIC